MYGFEAQKLNPSIYLINWAESFLLWQSFTQHQSTADEQLPKTYNVIDQKSPVFIGTVIGFGGMTLAFFTINLALKWFRARRLHKQSQDVETGQGQGETFNIQ